MLIALALFLGCPEPPAEVGANNGAGGTPMGNPDNNGVTPPPEGATPGPADGPGAPPPYDPEIELTQEALKDLDHVTITGELICENAEGPYVIHLFPPPPEGEEGAIEEGPPPRPLSGAKVEKAGEFSFMAPKGGTGMVLGFVDTDNDNIPSEAGIFFANKSMPISLEADTTVKLDCSESAPPVAEMPAGEGATPPPGGEMPPPPPAGGEPPAGEAPGAGEVPPAAPPAGEPPAAEGAAQ